MNEYLPFCMFEENFSKYKERLFALWDTKFTHIVDLKEFPELKGSVFGITDNGPVRRGTDKGLLPKNLLTELVSEYVSLNRERKQCKAILGTYNDPRVFVGDTIYPDSKEITSIIEICPGKYKYMASTEEILKPVLKTCFSNDETTPPSAFWLDPKGEMIECDILVSFIQRLNG